MKIWSLSVKKKQTLHVCCQPGIPEASLSWGRGRGLTCYQADSGDLNKNMPFFKSLTKFSNYYLNTNLGKAF